MLRVQVLGGLDITLNDEPLTGFISSKAQALFCYVVLNRSHAHLRSALATMFWGDMVEEDASTNLRQAIANLKKLAEPFFEITRHTLAFQPLAPYWLDFEEFEKNVEKNGAAAVPLYKGDLLAGFNLPDAPEFDAWVVAERERLHEQAVTLLRRHASHYLSIGQEHEAIATLERLLVLDPLHEEAHRQLMFAYAIDGRRSAALSQYETCRRILRRELDIEPEPETLHMYNRIRSAQRLTNLAPEVTPFIGREAELKTLTQYLMDPFCHLVTIVGLGGMGKTRLALHAAHRHVNRMLNGAVMVNLASIQTLDGVLSALAMALNYKTMHRGTPRDQLLSYLGEKHLLLVLDNFEALIAVASGFISELIQAAPDLKILITSRQRLDLRSEWVLALDGLPVAETSGDTEIPSSAPAQALFWETARRVRGDNLLTNQYAASVSTICQLVAGMPLAIELAAAWSRLLTCDELAAELATNLIRLEAINRNGDIRHQSLHAVFDHSWQLFSAQEQRVLMALSTFADSFTREAAERVAGATLPMLLGLADKMLIRNEPDNRYSLHQMTREYFAERLTESGERSAVEARFVGYFAHFIAERAPHLKAREQRATIIAIRQEIDNLHRAWSIATANVDQHTLNQLMPTIALFHDITFDTLVAANLFLEARPIYETASRETYGAWLSHLALFYSRFDDRQQTEHYANQCLELLDESQPQERDSFSRALIALGHSAGLRNAHNEACIYFEHALKLRLMLDDEWGRAQCYMRLASAHGQMEKLEPALAYAEKGLSISQKLGEAYLTARFQTLLATIIQMSGNLDEAERLHRETLDIYEAFNDLDGRALAYNGLGNDAFLRKNYAEAEKLYLEAHLINCQLGARAWQAVTLNNLGEAARERGDLYIALDYFQQSHAIFSALGHERYEQVTRAEIEILKERISA